jgi:tetratricopeptide (TPR) repeat protein
MTSFELNAEATRLMREFRESEALGLQQQACEVAKSEGVDPVTYAALLSNLALLHRRLGHFAEAESGYAEALRLTRAAGPGFEANVAQVANNLGVLVGEQGRYAESLAFLKESAAIRRDLADHLGLAETFVNLASLYKVGAGGRVLRVRVGGATQTLSTRDPWQAWLVAA